MYLVPSRWAARLPAADGGPPEPMDCFVSGLPKAAGPLAQKRLLAGAGAWALVFTFRIRNLLRLHDPYPPICTLVMIDGPGREGVPKDRSVRCLSSPCEPPVTAGPI